MRRFGTYLCCATAALLLSLGLGAQVKVVDPSRRGMDPERLARLDEVIEDCIAQGNIPGAVISVVRGRDIVYLKAYGNKSLVPETEPMTVETIFDLASLSKCVGTTLAIMQLVEGGYIRLTDTVMDYIPEFRPWTDPATGDSRLNTLGERFPRGIKQTPCLVTYRAYGKCGRVVPVESMDLCA